MNKSKKQCKKREFSQVHFILIVLLTLCLALFGCSNSVNEPTKHTITQYGCWYGSQMMFYTITNDAGGLIVVDGGSADNTDEVRKVIYTHGNHVDAWFITHPHYDHVGAFNEIWQDLQEITIDAVFAVEMPSSEEITESAHWDVDHYAYEVFRSLDIPVKNYVQVGEIYHINGLEIRILNAFDEHVREVGIDFLNNGSMMFMVSGNSQNMLFCGDVTFRMQEWLINKYGEELKADFIQMGHHGNGNSTLRPEFLDIVGAEYAFFDSPYWLFNDDTGRFDNEWVKEYMQVTGTTVFNFETAPNSVLLR